MDFDQIEALALALAQAAGAEMMAKQELNELEESFTSARARVLYDGYMSGEIDGKNAEMRAVQETVLLDNDESIEEIQLAKIAAATKLIDASVARILVDTRVSLTRAWLYSTSEQK